MTRDSIFRYFPGVSMGNFHQGRNLWKWAEAKVWQIVVNLRTKFLCVLIVLCLVTGMWRVPYAYALKVAAGFLFRAAHLFNTEEETGGN